MSENPTTNDNSTTNDNPATPAVNDNPINLRDKVEEALRTVYDPEIPVNIFDLGLVYETMIDEGKVKITMTLTAPACPAAGEIIHDVQQKIEAIEGVLADWSVSGDHAPAAAYDVARTVCRRAERNVVRLAEAGEAVEPNVLAYLNRLSDLIWLFGRKLEFDAGLNASLRAANEKAGPRWSRAW